MHTVGLDLTLVGRPARPAARACPAPGCTAPQHRGAPGRRLSHAYPCEPSARSADPPAATPSPSSHPARGSAGAAGAGRPPGGGRARGVASVGCAARQEQAPPGVANVLVRVLRDAGEVVTSTGTLPLQKGLVHLMPAVEADPLLRAGVLSAAPHVEPEAKTL
jgi:hypothetical protein